MISNCPDATKSSNLKKVVIIGSGFSGLAASACLAKAGFEVKILEKNATVGGRARQFEQQGFVFDMGPSWYWMPDVFEDFFQQFGKTTSDYYQLQRLDPSYRIFFGAQNDYLDVPAGETALEQMFEQLEPGSIPRLRQFLADGKFKYETGMRKFVHKPGHSMLEFANLDILKSAFRLQLFSSLSKEVRRKFNNPRLIKLLEFPVLFLGSTAEKTPALYSLMNYADMALGTWYPMGGMYKIVAGMTSLAQSLGVEIETGQEVRQIQVVAGMAQSVQTDSARYPADVVLGAADYHHIEQNLLEKKYRMYDEAYWQSRKMAPSSMLFYLGVNKRLKNLLHHNLFFDSDFAQHVADIYDRPAIPENPLFYVCAPSVTDPSVAPEACENLFILIPLAPGLEVDDAAAEQLYQLVLQRLEKLTGQSIADSVIFRRDFSHRDFVKDYHAFKGNAYGLANTLLQTAFLKPKLKSTKVDNLYFAGQLTTPGPGVPPSLISGQVAAGEIINAFKSDINKRL